MTPTVTRSQSSRPSLGFTAALSCQYRPTGLRNLSSILWNLELRQFWKKTQGVAKKKSAQWMYKNENRRMEKVSALNMNILSSFGKKNLLLTWTKLILWLCLFKRWMKWLTFVLHFTICIWTLTCQRSSYMNFQWKNKFLLVFVCLCVGKLTRGTEQSQEEESRNRDTSQTDGHFLLPHVFGVLFGQASLELVRHALVAVLTHGLQIHLHKPVPEQQHRVTDITLRTNSFISTSC